MLARILAMGMGMGLILMVFGGLRQNWLQSKESGVIKVMSEKPWRTLDATLRCVAAIILGLLLVAYAVLGHL